MSDKAYFDTLVYKILQECADVDPPLLTKEICKHVLDELKAITFEQVSSSLGRLEAEGKITRVQDDVTGVHNRYRLSELNGYTVN